MYNKILMLVLLLGVFGLRGANLELTEEWPHDMPAFGMFYNAEIHRGKLCMMFFKNGVLVADRSRILKMAEWGEGPDDLSPFTVNICVSRDRLASFEWPAKIKFWDFDGEKYRNKGHIWFPRKTTAAYNVRNAAYIRGKWVLGGYFYETASTPDVHYRLQVYADDGKFEKFLLYGEDPENRGITRQFAHMRSAYIGEFGGDIFLLREDRLRLHLISAEDFSKKGTADLATPAFYRKIPDNAYQLEKRRGYKRSTVQYQISEWKTGYSRINNVAIHRGRLVLQIRSADPKGKRFALLFYEKANFKLEKILMFDDFLLTISGDRFYFLKNGNPYYDEDAENFHIRVYDWKEKDLETKTGV